jgi:hypothetical protein
MNLLSDEPVPPRGAYSGTSLTFCFRLNNNKFDLKYFFVDPFATDDPFGQKAGGGS